MKKIKFIIDSNLENVALVGMSIKRLCSLIPFSDAQSYQVELCAVEAINNSIIHAYNGELLHKVETILSIDKGYLTLEICDNGKALDPNIIEKAGIDTFNLDTNNLDEISESGRGLAVIKEIMDKVTYESDNGVNRLIMIKTL